jgi:two-component system OmpR family response regulator
MTFVTHSTFKPNMAHPALSQHLIDHAVSFILTLEFTMAITKILVVEDDPNLLATLRYNLQRESYNVVTAVDGTEALEVARREKPGLIVLDVMLPKLSGFDVCRILRKETTVPILMLTAKNEEVDKIVGFEIGADDYMTKPFSMRELLARIRAMLRRADMAKAQLAAEQASLKIGDLEIDVARHQAFCKSLPLDLAPKEFDLLVFLASNKGFVFSREQLLEKVWGYDYAGDSRTVDVHIRWLRQKIEDDPAKPKRLVTVRGTGYKLVG